MVLVDDLAAIGLTTYEAKAYAALQELGEAKSGKLSERSGVPTSHLYRVMEQLIENGLAAEKRSNKTRIFVATAPEAFAEYVATKKREAATKEKAILEQLTLYRTLPKNQETAAKYQYFEGVAGIKALFHAINEQMQPGSESVVLSANVKTWEKLDAFLLEHHQVRMKKNVHERMILPMKGKRMAKAREDVGNIEIRYLDHDNEAEYGVFGDLVAVLYHGSKTPRGFLIEDATFAQMFRNIFEMLWRDAKLS